MGHPGNGFAEKRNCSKQSSIISILVSMIILQTGIAYGAYVPTARAATPVSCVDPAAANPVPSAPPAPATRGIVLINEILTAPDSQWNCSAPDSNGSYPEDAWIEIYNTQNQPFDLYAARASIDQGQGTQSYVFPFGSIIAAKSFLVLFPFTSLSSLSVLRLTISQVVIDQVSVPSLATDTSYVRIPDGSTNWQTTLTPTPGNGNTLGTPTATATSKQSTKKSSTTSKTKRKSTTTRRSSSSNSDGTDLPSTGVQPTWSALRLPTSHKSTPHNASLPTTSTDSLTFLQRILLTLLLIVFVFAPLGGWRLYRFLKSRKTTILL